MLREVRPGSDGFAAFVRALVEAGLPTDDLSSEPFRYFSHDEAGWGGIGTGADALLRSIVVPPSARNLGRGAALTEALARQAREDGVARLWLLTTSAAPFFEKLGWRQADRAQAPAAIACSRQFADLCPASAVLMVRAL